MGATGDGEVPNMLVAAYDGSLSTRHIGVIKPLHPTTRIMSALECVEIKLMPIPSSEKTNRSHNLSHYNIPYNPNSDRRSKRILKWIH